MNSVALVMRANEDQVRGMLSRLRSGGSVSSVMRGMTERRQHRFFLTSQAVDLLYTTDHQHPNPREEVRAEGLAAFHSPSLFTKVRDDLRPKGGLVSTRS